MSRIGYADPPYPGMSHRYKDHPDYDGEVDHVALIKTLEQDFDGWVLHTSVPAVRDLIPHIPKSARMMSWVKPFAAFKRNVPVAYAWEPVFVKPIRKPKVRGICVMRDWMAASCTLKKGLVGAKPLDVCVWLFEVVGADPEDDLVDMFPGTGAVTASWEAWRHMRAALPESEYTAAPGSPLGIG